MIVSRAVTDNLTKASWIRRMFEEGARLKQERGADKVFDFTLGNPEIEPPEAVLAAARRVLESKEPHLHAYMPNAGQPRVREAVAARLRGATGLPYTANHIIMTVGAGAALNIVLKALLDPGDEVVTVAPFFAEYGFYAENHGGRLVVVQPRADLTPDIAKLEAAITSRTRAILVNSPNNPSGVIYPASTFVEIEAVLARAARPIVLISDEPYRALVFDDVVVPQVPPLVTRSIVATSWSKSLAIPGERIGYLAFSPRMPEAADLFEACTFTSRVLGFVNAPALWQWVVVDVIVAAGPALPALKQATSTIPIVMAASNDPVGLRYVQSLGHPSGNITGLSLQSTETTGKRLELLKELVPSAGLVAVVWDRASLLYWQAAEAAARERGWKLLSLEIRDAGEIEGVFRAATDARAGALLVSAAGLLFPQARRIAELAARSRLPAMYELRPYVEAGGLISYGADINEIWRRAAVFVDKILSEVVGHSQEADPQGVRCTRRSTGRPGTPARA